MLVGLASLLPSAWLARNLPTGELSVWPACASIVSIGYSLSNFGLRMCLVREVPKLVAQGHHDRACSMLRTGLLLTTLGALFVGGIAFLLADDVTRGLLKDEVPADVVRVLAVAISLTIMVTHFEWFLNAFQQFKLFAVSRTIRSVMQTWVAAALYGVWGIEGAVAGLSIAALSGCLVCGIGLWPKLSYGRGLEPVGALLQQSVPYYASSITSGLIARMDYLLVGVVGGTQSLATYYVAFKIIEYVRYVDTHLMDALSPKLSETAHKGRSTFEEGFAKCSRYFFLGLVPLHVGLAAVGRPLITLYAGQEYAGAGIVFSILCVYLLLETLFGLYRQHIIALGNRWHPLVLDAMSALCRTSLLAVLSVFWGSVGAAAALCLSFLCMLPIAVHLTRRIFEPRHSRSTVLQGTAGAVVVLCFTLMWLNLFPGSLAQIAAITITPLLYALMLRRKLRTEDMRLLRHLTPKRLQESPRARRSMSALERFFLEAPLDGGSAGPLQERR